MNIIAGKTYKTRDGRKVNIIYTNMRNKFPVIGIITKRTGYDRAEALISFTSEGKFYDDNRTSNLDLVEEYSIWNDVKRGTPVLVRDSCKDEAHRVYYTIEYDTIIVTILGAYQYREIRIKRINNEI